MSTGEFLLNYGIDILLGILAIISAIIATSKAKKSSQSNGSIELFSLIPSYVIEAEKMFGKGNGDKKINYVLTMLRCYALEHSLKVNNDELRAKIEDVVTATNHVNVEKENTPTNTETDEIVSDNTKDVEDIETSIEDNINI